MGLRRWRPWSHVRRLDPHNGKAWKHLKAEGCGGRTSSSVYEASGKHGAHMSIYATDHTLVGIAEL